MTNPGEETGQSASSNPSYPPPSGYPPPGYPPPPGYGPPPTGYPAPGQPKQGTNKMAIWSLVASLAGLLCGGVGSVIGIVLGVIALKQLNKTQEGGRGLATWGVAIGIITLLIILPSTIAILRS